MKWLIRKENRKKENRNLNSHVKMPNLNKEHETAKKELQKEYKTLLLNKFNYKFNSKKGTLFVHALHTLNTFFFFPFSMVKSHKRICSANFSPMINKSTFSLCYSRRKRNTFALLKYFHLKKKTKK